MATRVGSYDVVDLVADSPSGGLWRGHDAQLDRFVALKQVTDSTSPAAQRLRGEARMLAGITHEHIVAVYELIENQDGLWLVEEWVSGHPLARVRAEAGRLTPAQAVGVVRAALQGLAHAHSLGIVHGDLTPSNVLVDQSGTAKLIDFGLARAVGDTLAPGTGSPGFISPQLAEGLPATAADDVYAAGALLASLLTDRPVFTGTTPDAVLASQLGPGPDLAGIPRNTRAVLSTALAPDTGSRYPDAGRFLQALEEAARRDQGAGWLAQASLATVVAAIGATAGATVLDATAAGDPGVSSTRTGSAREARATSRRTLRTGRRAGRVVARSHLLVGAAGATATVVAIVAAVVLTTGNHPKPAAATGATRNAHVAAPTPTRVTGKPTGAAATPTPSAGASSPHVVTAAARWSSGAVVPAFDSDASPTPGATSTPTVALSCPVNGFCMAVDGAGDAYTFNGSTWSAPTHLGSSAALSTPLGAQQLSCVSTTFCMLVGTTSGHSFTYDGTTWTAGPTTSWDGPGTAAQHQVTAVACPQAGLCYGTGHDGCAAMETCTDEGQGVSDADITTLWRWSSGTWTEMSAPGKESFQQSAFGNGAISCGSPTFCRAMSLQIFSLTGNTWGVDPVPADLQGDVSGMNLLACTASQFCMVGYVDGKAAARTGGLWGKPVTVDTRAQPNDHVLTGLACEDPGFCMASTADGWVYTYSKGHWSVGTVVSVTDEALTLSCASASYCVAIDSAGETYVFAPATGTATPAAIPQQADPLQHSVLT